MPTPREMIVSVIRPIQHFPSRAYRKRVSARTTLPTGHDRVYSYHIRKTAGTSLGMAFLGLGGDAEALYGKLHQRGRWVDANGVLCVRSDRHLLAEGFYVMGSSHSEAWRITLPPNTFRLTCLRDPVARVLSHYRMLLHFARTQPDRIPKEQRWLGNGLGDFLDNIPRAHLLRQLRMFSRHDDVDEAVEFIAGLEFVMHQESFDDDLKRLAELLELPLLSHRAKNYQKDTKAELPEDQVERLREMMEPEYEMFRRLEARGI